MSVCSDRRRSRLAAKLSLVVLVLAWSLSGRAAQSPRVPSISFDHYHTSKEVKAFLDGLAAAYPKLVRVSSIGKDFKGYDTWMIEITNQDAGKPEEKPAFYADGNMDNDEASTTEVILYVAQRVLARYGQDAEITRLLDTSTLYLVPMCNPYMTELFVSTPMSDIVSSINARPTDDDKDGRFDEDPPEDLDGDGEIVEMRVRDPRGDFKTNPRDPRLLVRRNPDELGEWAVYSEGIDNDGDGLINEDWIGGRDLNRNFPFDWQPEWIQEGAGPYPLSEPESRNMVDFFLAHPNINFAINGHSGPDDGVIYRPYGSRADTAIPRQDYLTMGTFARKWAELSGGLQMVPPYGPHAERRFGPGRLVYGHGFLLEWVYEMAGGFSFAPETGMIPGDANKDGRVTDEELIKLSDEEFGGKLFAAWKPFKHPTLGTVEIGGFTKWTKPNPPPGKYLQRLVETYGAMYLYWASTMPRLAIPSAEARATGSDFAVRATIENAGLLPTNVTEKSIENGYAAPVEVTIATSPNVEVIAGGQRTTLGHLRGLGFRYGQALSSGIALDGSAQSKDVSWVVRLRDRASGWVEITASTPKAGVARKRVTIGGAVTSSPAPR